MGKTLRIATDFHLPLDMATQTCAILAKRRVGKTYTASVLAEEFAKVGQPFVVLDPTGAWWGLRSSADGTRAGYPVLIIGGAHGDVPLEATAGKVIADLVVDHPGAYVLDLSDFMSDAEQDRFAADFAVRLFRRKQKEKFPLHLIVDEADAFMPQKVQRGQERMLGAFEALTRRGGIHGIGMTVITHRPAVINKNVLTQCELLVILQIVSPQDRSAILDYVKGHGTKEQVDTLALEMASLGKGEAYVWSPAWLDVFKKIHVRERGTFNSSATPKVGEKRIEPTAAAPVDLNKLKSHIAATVEKAKADDPTLLRKRIAELEKAAKSPQRDPKLSASRVEVDTAYRDGYAKGKEYVTDKMIGAAVSAATRRHGVQLQRSREALRRLHQAIIPLVGLSDKVTDALKDDETVVQNIAAAVRVTESQTVQKIERVRTQNLAPLAEAHSGEGAMRIAVAHDGVSGPEQRVLDAIAWQESLGIAQPSVNAVAMLAKYSASSGGFKNLKGGMRSKGLIEYPSPGTMMLTAAGRALANTPDGDVTDEEMQRRVFETLSEPQKRILSPLISSWPEALTTAQVAEAAKYEPTSGGFKNLKGGLRTLGLVDYPTAGLMKASDLLFPISSR